MRLKYIITLVMLLPILLMAKNLDLIKKKSFNVKHGEILKLKTDLGDVIVKTWDNDKLQVKIYGDNDAEDKMDFLLEQNNRGVRIIGELEGVRLFRWFSNIELKYEINLPKNFNTDIKTAGGDIMLKSIDGIQELKTSGGDIFVKESEGELVAITSGGDIVIRNFYGDSELITSGGDIRANVIGEITAKTSGGDIKIKSKNGNVLANTSGGDIVFEYAGHNYGVKLSTSGGDIDAKVPTDFDADVELKTSGGDVKTALENIYIKKKSESKVIGTLNTGGNKFICKTSGGDIFVKTLK